MKRLLCSTGIFIALSTASARAQDPLATCVSIANEDATLARAVSNGYEVRKLDVGASARFVKMIRDGGGAQITARTVIGLTRGDETIVLLVDGADLCAMPAITSDRFKAGADAAEGAAL